MDFLFRKRSDLDDLLKPRRSFTGLKIGILAFVLLIALVWYFFSEHVPDAPPPAAVAPAPAPVPTPAPVPEPTPEPAPAPEPAVVPPLQKLPPKPQKVKPAPKQSESPAPARESDKPDSDAGN
jgi:outer membrane biosynthesis protein TonB